MLFCCGPLLKRLRTLLCCALLSLVQFDLWMTNPEMFFNACHLIVWHLHGQAWYMLISRLVSLTVVFLFWWNQGPPPERSPYVPKRHRRWRRLPQQFCQILKSWTHCISKCLSSARISADQQLTMLHVKLQGAILAHQNSRRLHVRKLLAFKHNCQAFSKPRV